MRIRAFPFGAEVEDFIDGHEFCFVVEQNRDAQLRSLLTLETSVPKEKLRSVLVYGGFPLSARHVVDGIFGRLAQHAEAVPPLAHDTLPEGDIAGMETRWRFNSMPSIAKPPVVHPSAQRNAAWADDAGLRRVDVHAVRGLRTRFRHRGDRARVVGTFD